MARSALFLCTMEGRVPTVLSILLLCGLAVAAGCRDAPVGFVQRAGRQFQIAKRPFYFSGWNTYWLMAKAANPATRYQVDQVLSDGASMGMTVCRSWAFNEDVGSPDALLTAPGVYNENVFKGLDYAISRARASGVRLLLTLSNNWNWYGGRQVYVAWSKAHGGAAQTEDDFYTDPLCKQYFKDHVKTVLNRVNTVTGVMYKNDPTIFGWELMNEPRCSQNPQACLPTWVTEMATYLKSIDKNHMVAIGSEGFFGPSSPDKVYANPGSWAAQVGADYVKDAQLPVIDFTTIHLYTDGWLPNGEAWTDSMAFADTWIKAHTDSISVDKPFILSEVGFQYAGTQRDQLLKLSYDAVVASKQNGKSLAGTMLWMLTVPNTENKDFGVLLSDASTTSIVSSDSAQLGC